MLLCKESLKGEKEIYLLLTYPNFALSLFYMFLEATSTSLNLRYAFPCCLDGVIAMKRLKSVKDL